MTILCIGGTDSSSGAGLSADIRTANELGVHTCIAVTAVTAQGNSKFSSEPITPTMLEQQIVSAIDNFDIKAIKTGMLSDKSAIEVLCNTLPKNIPLIIDPVLKSTSNHPLIKAEDIEYFKSKLLPRADIITPNLEEAKILANSASIDEQELAKIIYGLYGIENIVITGLIKDNMIYNLHHNKGTEIYHKYQYYNCNMRGTGCTFTTTIACNIAKNSAVDKSINLAGNFVNAKIASFSNLLA